MSDCGCHEQFVCDYCDEAFERYRQVIMGWAFDAGMREAERDRAQRCFVIQLSNERAAVAAERERCLYACYHESRFDHQSIDNVRDFIESGAPAPREG